MIRILKSWYHAFGYAAAWATGWVPAKPAPGRHRREG